MFEATSPDHVGKRALYLAPPISRHLTALFCDWPRLTNSANDCDFIVHSSILWADPNTPQLLGSLSREHSGCRKKVIVFIVDDYEGRYRWHANLILVRTSMRASLQRRNEFTLPYLWESVQAPLAPLPTGDKALVGFCGQVNKYRRELVRVFESSAAVRCNFITRDLFWGGKPHDPNLVAEFQRNIADNQFTLCNRGGGNFSMRFYQTLAAGRIPIVVDTDMKLPFDDIIDWKRTIIIEKTEQRCLDSVIEANQSGRVEQMQRACADTYWSHFSHTAFPEALIAAIQRRSALELGGSGWSRRVLAAALRILGRQREGLKEPMA